MPQKRGKRRRRDKGKTRSKRWLRAVVSIRVGSDNVHETLQCGHERALQSGDSPGETKRLCEQCRQTQQTLSGNP